MHRKGRTARAGKTGRSLVVGMPFEAATVGKLSKRASSYNVKSSDQTDKFDCKIRKLVLSGHPVLKGAAESAVKSFAAYYLIQPRVSTQLLKEATSGLSRAFGLPNTWKLPNDFNLDKPPFNARR